jgi:hypothetical protein
MPDEVLEDCVVFIEGPTGGEYRLQYHHTSKDRYHHTSEDVWERAVPQASIDFIARNIQGLTSRIGRGRDSRPGEAELLGARLYDIIFANDRLERNLGSAIEREVRFRLLLRLPDTPLINAIPWEMMFDSSRESFLALSRHLRIIRYAERSITPQIAEPIVPPLRVLIVVSDILPGFNEEVRLIQEAWSTSVAQGAVQLTLLKAPSVDELYHRLTTDHFDILHVQGRCEHDTESGRVGLVFTGEKIIPASILVRHKPVRLVFLSTFNKQIDADLASPNAYLARELIHAGALAVIAPQFKMTDVVAADLVGQFYKRLVTGSSVEESLTDARRIIFQRHVSLEWAAPFLYLQDLTEIFLWPTKSNIRHRPDTLVDEVANAFELEEITAWKANSLISGSIHADVVGMETSVNTDKWRLRLDAADLGRALVHEFGVERAKSLVRIAAIELLGEIIDLPVKELRKTIAGNQLSILKRAKRELVVSHGGHDRRLSLLLLMGDQDFASLRGGAPAGRGADSPIRPITSGLSIPVGSLAIGPLITRAWRRLAHRETGHESQGLAPLMQLMNSAADASGGGTRIGGAAAVLLWIARPRLVVTHMPRMVPLCVPRPPFDIDGPDEKISTAGALVRDAEGRIGVTACFHGTGTVGTTVRLGSNECQVALATELHDTVFLLLPDRLNLPELYATKGPLADRPPWETEKVVFWGRTSGERTTTVVSVDRGLPTIRPGKQMCVQTRPDTEEGDSGAALVNQSDNLVGFAFQRTAYGEPLEFTDWIWAAAALQALGLNAFE